jgi:hypothetical protein
MKRAQGRPGATAPMVRVQQKSTRQNHRYRRINRPSLRDGFTAYTCSSRGPGFLAPVISGSFRQLSASVGAPEPHDFAVRTRHVRRTWRSRPSHPRPTHRDDRPKRPSSSGRDARENGFDLPDGASVIRAADWHDGQFAHGVHARDCRCRSDPRLDQLRSSPIVPSLRGALATKQSRAMRAVFPRPWIASRSLSSGSATRRPGGSQ